MARPALLPPGPILFAVCALLIAAALGLPGADRSPGAAAGRPAEIELRGRVVCLHEEMHRLYGTDLPNPHRHVLGFQSAAGEYYTLLRTRFSLALFDDERLRTRDLLLRGRLFPGSRIFEPTHLKSIRNGVTNELYYYCQICSIRGTDPGPCACCQEDVELTEKPE